MHILLYLLDTHYLKTDYSIEQIHTESNHLASTVGFSQL